jgi:exodeoxyribonuclease VII small subunit
MEAQMAGTEGLDDLTYEQALHELEEIVSRLEAGGLTLEESLLLFERGRALSTYCGAQLDQAGLKLKELTPEGESPLDLPL